MADIRPMLPPLAAAHNVPPIPSAGIWHKMGGSPLELIARGLNTGPQLSASAAPIVSVPDVWAQVTVFANALAQDAHPMHTRAVGEWRGLLACFALAADTVSDLTSKLVTLNPRQSGWMDVAGRLPPQCPLLDGRRLSEVALVRAGGTLIALAQPLTLLAPSRSLPDHKGRPPVPWIIDGAFRDPLQHGGISTTDVAVLAAFLKRLCDALDQERTAGREVSWLLGRAREYLKDVSAGPAAPAGLQLAPAAAAMDLPALAVFNPLRTPYHAVTPRMTEAPSDLLLTLRPELSGTRLKGIILLDPSLHGQLGIQPSNILVWGRATLRRLQDRPEEIPAIRRDAESSGYLLVTPDDLFLPSLYRIDGADGEQHPAGAKGHLLPLSPLVLALYDRRELAGAFSMTDKGGGAFAVALRLALGSGQSVVLSRSYQNENSAEPSLTLATWPDFRAEWWRLHLAYASATKDIQFVTTGFVSVPGLRAALSSATDAFSAVTAARGILSGKVEPLARTTSLSPQKGVARALHQLEGFAEAAVMQDERKSAPRLAGLLLLQEPQQAPAMGSAAARIGVDFGTTNTAVQLKIGAQDSISLRINARHLLPYRLGPQSQEELDAELLPVTAVDMPFQTILKERRLPPQPGGRMAFRDTLIYFAQRRSSAMDMLKNGLTDSDLFANLKWGDDQAARERIELFLTEINVLALAEAAAKGVRPDAITFCYSFPEAFRPQQLASFRGAARNAVVRALRMTGGESFTPREPEFQTESVATAQYFIHRLHTPATEGLVTFDIGGQTTDVAIVQSQGADSEKLAWRGSFQLAGRHLLIEFLRQNPAIIGQLARNQHELGQLAAALDRVGKTEGEKRTLGIELLVNSPAFATAFSEVLPTLAGMTDANRLRATALVGLGGLFDYVGRTVTHLAAQGRLLPRPSTPVSICLGGRASLIFRTLLQDPDEQRRALALFTAAAGDAMPLAQLVFSQDPKQEVAYGLVTDNRALTGQVPTEPLLGETLEFGGNLARAETLLSALDHSQPWRIAAGMEEFNRFLTTLPGIGIRATLPRETLAEMAGKANAEMAASMRTARAQNPAGAATPDTSAIEPPFIVLLRLLVQRLTTDPGAVAFL